MVCVLNSEDERCQQRLSWHDDDDGRKPRVQERGAIAAGSSDVESFEKYGNGGTQANDDDTADPSAWVRWWVAGLPGSIALPFLIGTRVSCATL